MDLTDKQWEAIEPHIPPVKRRKDGKGRPRNHARDVLNGILWILRTGAPWKDLPDRYPSRATCHRWLQRWCRDGTMKAIWAGLVNDLNHRGQINWEEAFIDGSFAAAKKGAPLLVRPSGEKAPNGWQSQMAMVLLSGLPSQAHRPRKSR